MDSSSRNVVAVSDDSLRSELLDALLDDEKGYRVIVVESISRAYSRIRQLKPDVVMVFMDIDDVNACQLLSMLEIDRALSGIPVVTCARHEIAARPAQCRCSPMSVAP